MDTNEWVKKFLKYVQEKDFTRPFGFARRNPHRILKIEADKDIFGDHCDNSFRLTILFPQDTDTFPDDSTMVTLRSNSIKVHDCIQLIKYFIKEE